MELELKHLAPYLPYRVKMKFYEGNGEPQLLTAISIGHNNSITLKFIDRYGKPNQWKPILRPLSDLTKEIEINGEKLVLYKLFYEMFGGGFNTYESFISHTKHMYENPLSMISYETAQLYFKYHFDVFGLIENNLAIDINTI